MLSNVMPGKVRIVLLDKQNRRIEMHDILSQETKTCAEKPCPNIRTNDNLKQHIHTLHLKTRLSKYITIFFLLIICLVFVYFILTLIFFFFYRKMCATAGILHIGLLVYLTLINIIICVFSFTFVFHYCLLHTFANLLPKWTLLPILTLFQNL